MKLGTKEIPALRLGAAAVLKAYLGGSQVWPLGFDPASLFAQGEQGVWYDPSDLSTLFQDSAGTTPVTAVEQPVGLMLDKSKGLVLGPELVTNGAFDTNITGWTGSGATLSWSSGSMRVASTVSNIGVSGYQAFSVTAGKLYKISGKATLVSGYITNLQVILRDTANGGSSLPLGGWSFNFAATAGITYEGSGYYYATSNATLYLHCRAYVGAAAVIDFDFASIKEVTGNHASQPTATSRPVLSARVNQYLATETLATQNVTTLAAQYRLSFEGTGTVTLSGTATGVYSAGSHLITCTAGTLTSTVSGSVTKADLRVANAGAGLPAYQRVNTATDYDTVGFPHYLRFDGVDDWLVTPTITPGIDKVQAFAGVRILTGDILMIAEMSPDTFNNNSFFIVAQQNLRFRAGGTTTIEAIVSPIPAPNTFLATGTGDISAPIIRARVNGGNFVVNNNSQGTGNFLAYPLYIGHRGGTMLPFNGHLYSLIVRFGPNLPTATIEKTEKYINTKTRAY